MGSAKALAIGWVEGGAAIAELFDVIREQPMLGRSLGAAAPVLNPLAPEASVEEHLLTPSLVLVGMVDGICPFRLDADCSPVRLRHQGSERLDSRHCPLPLLVVMDRSGIILSVPAVGLAPVSKPMLRSKSCRASFFFLIVRFVVPTIFTTLDPLARADDGPRLIQASHCRRKSDSK
jgi:hypothetical protein